MRVYVHTSTLGKQESTALFHYLSVPERKGV